MSSQTSDCPQSCVFDGGEGGELLTKWRLKGLTSLTRAHLAAALVFSSWCSRTQEASCR